jgi:hypothetical protein
MASPPASEKPPEPPEPFDPFQTPRQYRQGWLQRRREKMIAEIERNRRGEYTVPTWVLAAILAAFVLFWVGLIIFS